MTGVHIGIIAEDPSDVVVLKILARKVSGRNFSVSQHFGKGCGTIKAKTPGWCKALAAKGCAAVVLVHDRDDKDSVELRAQLETILATCATSRNYVVIPTEELEAWLLADTTAIKRAMRLATKLRTIHHPETIQSPKEHLGDLIVDHSKNRTKVYVNTEHNPMIANETDVSIIERKCPSFSTFATFVRTEIGAP